ncbi:MAG: helix-turn-helix domain-containing protein [Bacteroidota bacterium]
MGILEDVLKIASLNGFLIAFLFLISNKGNVQANRLYGSLVFILSAVVFENLLILSGDIFDYPHLFSAGAILFMLLPPIFYFLHLSLFESQQKIKPRLYLLHAIPFFICGISLLPFFSLSAEIKIEIIHNIYIKQQSLKGPYFWYSVLNILQFVIYILLTYRSIKSKAVQNLRKSIRQNLSWFNRLILLMNVILFIYILLYTSFFYVREYQITFLYAFVILILLGLYITCIYLIKDVFFFSLHQSEYKGSTLKEENLAAIREKLEKVLVEEKPYLRARLKLSELAALVGVNTHQLSQYLNQHRGESFNQFINSHRISFAKHLLTEDVSKKETILAIALDSGFSNQAHFIKVFKEATHKTPSQYREDQSKAAIFP